MVRGVVLLIGIASACVLYAYVIAPYFSSARAMEARIQEAEISIAAQDPACRENTAGLPGMGTIHAYRGTLTPDQPVGILLSCDWQTLHIVGAVEQTLSIDKEGDVDSYENELWWTDPLAENVVELARDFNFDGYNDLLIRRPEGLDNRAGGYVFLYDPASADFVRNDSAEDLTGDLRIELDPTTKRISTYRHSMLNRWAKAVYEWRESELESLSWELCEKYLYSPDKYEYDAQIYDEQGTLVSRIDDVTTGADAIRPECRALLSEPLQEPLRALAPSEESTACPREVYGSWPELRVYYGTLKDGERAFPIKAVRSCDSTRLVISGAVSQTLLGKKPSDEFGHYFPGDGTHSINFDEDYNFDGYNDLQVIVSAGSGWAAVITSNYYLYDPSLDSFEFNDELSSYTNLYVARDKRRLAVSQGLGMYWGHYAKYYVWRDGELVKDETKTCDLVGKDGEDLEYDIDPEMIKKIGYYKFVHTLYAEDGSIASSTAEIKKLGEGSCNDDGR